MTARTALWVPATPGTRLRTGLTLARGGFIDTAVDAKWMWMSAAGHAIALMLLYYLWRGIYADDGAIAGTAFRDAFLQLATAQTLFAVFYTFTDWQFARDIRSGAVASYLVQPVTLQWRYFSVAAGRVGANALVILPVWMGAVWLSGVDMLVAWWQLPAVVLSVAISFVLIFSLDFMIAMAAHLVHTPWGITASKDSLILFLGGAFLPAAYFPGWLQSLSAWLPFRHFFLTPIALLYGLGDEPAWRLLAEQFTWCVVLVLAARLALGRTQRRMTIYGA